MEEEIWRDIPGYEGLYQASNLGRVRSLDRFEEFLNNNGKISTRHRKGRILRPRHGRAQVTFAKDGVLSYPIVSRIVYSAFNGPIPEGMQVNHINEDFSDNRLENLNLMTPKENTNWGTGIRRRAKSASLKMKGRYLYDKNPNSKSVMEYNRDGVPVCVWLTIKAAAEYHNKSCSSIMLILAGKRKSLKDGTYFKYIKKGA